MKVLFELQNINGNAADIIAPDGSTILFGYVFNTIPEEHKYSGSGSDGLANDLISLKRDGIKIKYDENKNSEEH